MIKWAVLGALIIATGAHAEPEAKYGNALSLAKKCRNAESGDMFGVGSCYEFLRGMMAGLMISDRLCIAPNARISNGKLKDIFLGYLARHDESAEEYDSVVVALALAEAFPCPASK